jgi:ketosteroid isomerase-like protein
MSVHLMTPIEWYIDPPWDLVAQRWLLEYVLNLRGNPVGLGRLMGTGAELEMVPMPKELLQNLARGAPQGGVPVPAADHLAARNAARYTPDVEKLIGSFVEAVDAGNVEAAMATVSPSYFDPHGRNRAQLQHDLTNLFNVTKNRRVARLEAPNLTAVGDHVFAQVKVGWEADITAAHKSQTKHGASTIELLLERSPEGAWKITSIKMI